MDREEMMKKIAEEAGVSIEDVQAIFGKFDEVMAEEAKEKEKPDKQEESEPELEKQE